MCAVIHVGVWPPALLYHVEWSLCITVSISRRWCPLLSLPQSCQGRTVYVQITVSITTFLPQAHILILPDKTLTLSYFLLSSSQWWPFPEETHLQIQCGVPALHRWWQAAAGVKSEIDGGLERRSEKRRQEKKIREYWVFRVEGS